MNRDLVKRVSTLQLLNVSGVTVVDALCAPDFSSHNITCLCISNCTSNSYNICEINIELPKRI